MTTWLLLGGLKFVLVKHLVQSSSCSVRTAYLWICAALVCSATCVLEAFLTIGKRWVLGLF